MSTLTLAVPLINTYVNRIVPILCCCFPDRTINCKTHGDFLRFLVKAMCSN